MASLPRRVADILDELGDVQVQDIACHSEVPRAKTVLYYDREPRRR
ncbi:hypothetical protein ACIOD2_27595 [Amycolatopsis sp. NPDC088138]